MTERERKEKEQRRADRRLRQGKDRLKLGTWDRNTYELPSGSKYIRQPDGSLRRA